MRLAICALFLSVGTAAICQLATPAPASPNPQGPNPPQVLQSNIVIQQKTIFLPTPVQLQQRNSAQIDPSMIVHPPQSSVAVQTPGTQIAQNLYPGLTLMPIDQWKGNGQQIPITWPNLKVQNIPTSWPKFEIKSVQSSPASIPAGK